MVSWAGEKISQRSPSHLTFATHSPFLPRKYSYKLIQRFRVTCLFTGQYTIKNYGTITDVIK